MTPPIPQPREKLVALLKDSQWMMRVLTPATAEVARRQRHHTNLTHALREPGGPESRLHGYPPCQSPRAALARWTRRIRNTPERRAG